MNTPQRVPKLPEAEVLAISNRFFGGKPVTETAMKEHIKFYAPYIRVLHVEDDPEMQRKVRYMLQEYRFQHYATANNGLEGLRAYKDGIFHLVITDFEMPIMNGVEMIEKIMEIHPKQIIMALSSYEQEAFIKKAFRSERVMPVTNRLGGLPVSSTRHVNKSQIGAGFLWALTRTCGFVATDLALESTTNETKRLMREGVGER